MRITLDILKKHIKKCKKRNIKFNFLGFLENKELDREVKSLFSFDGIGISGYDWINGNSKLKMFI